MSKVTKTINLKDASYGEVSEFLGKNRFHAENKEGASSATIDTEASFEYWKIGILDRYANSSIKLTAGGDWFEEVRIQDTFFEASAKSSSESRQAYLASIGDGY